MSSYRRLRLMEVAFLSIMLSQTAHGFDIVSIAVGALVSSSLATLTNWIISPNHDQAEYERRDSHFKTLSKEHFLEEIKTISEVTGQDEKEILSQHELYRYPNFIEAIKIACPGYAKYIKKLYQDLTSNYKARVVRGFKVERQGSLIARNLRSIQPYDYYEFYDLIGKLRNEIITKEQQEAERLKQAQDQEIRDIIAVSEKLIQQLPAQEQYTLLEKLINQLPPEEQQTFLSKQLKDLKALDEE